MELSTELFKEIAMALQGAVVEKTSIDRQEKRSGERLVVAADVWIAPFGVASAQPRQVKLRSLSRAGAAVLDSRILQMGEKVVLYLPKPDGQAVPIVCMVKNSRMRGAEFRVGVEFLSRAEEATVPMLRAADGIVNHPITEGPLDVLDAVAEGRELGRSGSDGRENRVELNMNGMISPYPEGQGSNLSIVTVKDISSGGVCIVQPEEMEPGEQFVLQIPRGAGKPLTMICTVIDCRRVDDTDFRIGARLETRLLPDTKAEVPPPRLFTRLRRWFAA